MEGKKVSKTRSKVATPAESGKLAVFALGGSQHLVREGNELTVHHLDLKDGKSAKAEAIILEPAFGKGSVTYKLLEQKKGKKILVMKYKAKSRYRKKRGYRSELSKILVEKIDI
ncbi:MAG TPA: 50S ribosomal protein L21 [Patescibacteria group bacterium]|nr:50S ribosomal protein L21 [Patescibacteria group bacterium]